MTLKEFEEIAATKTQEEYESWFDERARFQIQIGGISMPCIKVSRSKVALRDKVLFSLSPDKGLYERNDSWDFKNKRQILRIYDTLSVEDKMSVREYFRLLERKTEMERRIRQKEEFPDKVFCSFCGRPEDECKKIIAGPSNVFICDECVSLCGEIMEEELQNTEK